jgi:hypothetical protein
MANVKSDLLSKGLLREECSWNVDIFIKINIFSIMN